MGDDVKSIVIKLKEYCLKWEGIKGVNDSRKCLYHFDILVLEALTTSEQDLLAQRVMPSESRAEEICAALKINMPIYNEAIQVYLSRASTRSPEEGSRILSFDSEEHFKMMENLGKKQKKGRTKE